MQEHPIRVCQAPQRPHLQLARTVGPASAADAAAATAPAPSMLLSGQRRQLDVWQLGQAVAPSIQVGNHQARFCVSATDARHDSSPGFWTIVLETISVDCKLVLVNDWRACFDNKGKFRLRAGCKAAQPSSIFQDSGAQVTCACLCIALAEALLQWSPFKIAVLEFSLDLRSTLRQFPAKAACRRLLLMSDHIIS